jgi:hypothetical protein
MLATIAEIITSVRYQINEATASFWSDAEITTYVNEAQEILATETKCLSKYYSHTLLTADIVNTREVRFYSDFVALDDGGIIYDDKPLEQISLNALNEHFSDWRTTTGTPTRFYLRSDYIGFFPPPSAGSVVEYYGIERATELSGSTVPLSSDYRTVSFRRYLRDYAIAMCWYKKSEDIKGDRFMARFDRGIYQINAILNNHKNQGGMVIPGYRSRRGSYSIKWGRTDYPID